MTTSTIADDRSPSDSDHKLNDILDTYSRTCLRAGFVAQLEMLVKPNISESLKRCDPSVLQNKVGSLLSDTVVPSVSDSAYREWYENSKSRLSSTVNLETTHSASAQFQEVTTQSIGENIIKGKDVLDEPTISTVKGYRTLDGG